MRAMLANGTLKGQRVLAHATLYTRVGDFCVGIRRPLFCRGIQVEDL